MLHIVIFSVNVKNGFFLTTPPLIITLFFPTPLSFLLVISCLCLSSPQRPGPVPRSSLGHSSSILLAGTKSNPGPCCLTIVFSPLPPYHLRTVFLPFFFLSPQDVGHHGHVLCHVDAVSTISCSLTPSRDLLHRSVI